MSIKVFICHASEDKERFVLDFSKKLREQEGFDAWVDTWEINHGDSLVDKIFGEGIKDMDVMLAIISTSSVKKPWVHEEINAGFIKKIEKKIRLIPVLIDECANLVPECLKSGLWSNLNNPATDENEYNKLVNSIKGIYDKPEIADATTNTINYQLGALSPLDSIVLKTIAEEYIQNDNTNTFKLLDILRSKEISDEDFLDSLEILEAEYLLEVRRVMMGGVLRGMRMVEPSLYGLELYCSHEILDYQKTVQSIASLIINKNILDSEELLENVVIKPNLMEHILRVFESNGYMKCHQYMGICKIRLQVNSTFKRWFQQQN